MSDAYHPKFLESGGVLQSGIPATYSPQTSPNGLLLRGVVVAVYVSDDPNYPYAQEQDASPVAIYCDVLTYSGVVGAQFQFLPNCLVSQETGGMQRGHIWRPRAATLDVTGNSMDVQMATNPADMDGDHVLVGFMDGQINSPVILRGIPHPSRDTGHTAQDALGARMKLVLADGDPDFRKHHGTFYGVATTGDYVVDTTRAYDGTLQTDGSEPAPSTSATKGNLLYNIEKNSKRLLQLLDMSSPASPTAVITELLSLAGYVLDFMSQTPAWQLKAGSNNVVNVANSGANATLTLGDGAKHVPIVEALQQFYTSLKAKLDAFDAHTHTIPAAVVVGTAPPGGGPITGGTTIPGTTGAPAPTIAAAAWDSSINSTKVAIPNG